MKKYIIKEQQLSYGYRVVEAESEEEALKSKNTKGDTQITDSGYYVVKEAKKLNDEKFVFCTQDEFQIIENSKEFQDKWEQEKRWRPYLDPIK